MREDLSLYRWARRRFHRQFATEMQSVAIR